MPIPIPAKIDPDRQIAAVPGIERQHNRDAADDHEGSPSTRNHPHEEEQPEGAPRAERNRSRPQCIKLLLYLPSPEHQPGLQSSQDDDYYAPDD